jgi:hypothetical protein
VVKKNHSNRKPDTPKSHSHTRQKENFLLHNSLVITYKIYIYIYIYGKFVGDAKIPYMQ